jgi:hypothetical protein
MQNVCWHPAFQVSANGREFGVEPCGKTVPPGRANKEMAFVADVFDPTADVKVV